MCKTNIILKSIFLLAFILITIFTGSYILFWPLLLYLVFLTIKDRNKIAIIIDIIILLILIFAKFNSVVRIILTVLMIADILILYFSSYSKDELGVLKEHINYSDSRNRKKIFYEKHEDKVKELVNKNAEIYGEEHEAVDNKVKRELDKLYLYSQVRFNGYDSKMTSILSKWTLSDLVFLVVSLTLLILSRIIWG